MRSFHRLRTATSSRTGVRPVRALSSAATMYRPSPPMSDPDVWSTSIIVAPPKWLPPKPVVLLWNGVPFAPCGAAVEIGAIGAVGVVGVEVPVVDPAVVPRRTPIRDVEPNIVPPVDVVVLEPDTVPPPDTDVVGDPDTVVCERASIACRICINNDEPPPDEAVVVLVVVVVAPHCVPDV